MAKDIYGTQYELSLTHDEVYTVSLLLAHVAGDTECYDLSIKLENILGRELTLEDFNRVTIKGEDEEGNEVDFCEDFTIKID